MRKLPENYKSYSTQIQKSQLLRQTFRELATTLAVGGFPVYDVEVELWDGTYPDLPSMTAKRVFARSLQVMVQDNRDAREIHGFLTLKARRITVPGVVEYTIDGK